MSTPQSSQTLRPAIAVYAAYTAAILFALHLATYFASSLRDATLSTSAVLAVSLALLAVAQHVVVFPVVAALPAPRWAQLAGYIWLVVDTASDLLQLGGTPKSVYLTLRLVINVVAAIWIASASWRAHGAMRVLGLIVAFDITAYSCVALLSPLAFVVSLPSLVLLPVWFVLVGRRIAQLPASAALRTRQASLAG